MAIVGDSIVAGNRAVVQDILSRAGVPATVIDAASGRAMSHRTAYGAGKTVSSGIDAVRAIRQAGHRPSLWVVELGTNDTWGVGNCRCPDPVAYAGTRIDLVRAEIGVGHQILWMNVRANSVGANAINEALRRRLGPSFGLIDWDAATRGHDGWFLDAVHPNMTGVFQLGDLLVRSILAVTTSPLPDHCGDPERETVRQPSPTAMAAATAGRSARRCQIG